MGDILAHFDVHWREISGNLLLSAPLARPFFQLAEQPVRQGHDPASHREAARNRGNISGHGFPAVYELVS